MRSLVAGQLLPAIMRAESTDAVSGFLFTFCATFARVHVGLRSITENVRLITLNGNTISKPHVCGDTRSTTENVRLLTLHGNTITMAHVFDDTIEFQSKPFTSSVLYPVSHFSAMLISSRFFIVACTSVEVFLRFLRSKNENAISSR